MAITTGHLSVTSTAAKVVEPDADGVRVILHVIGNNSVYLGDSTVALNNGLLIDKGAGPVEIRLAPGAALYAITSGTETMSYMILEKGA